MGHRSQRVVMTRRKSRVAAKMPNARRTIRRPAAQTAISRARTRSLPFAADQSAARSADITAALAGVIKHPQAVAAGSCGARFGASSASVPGSGRQRAHRCFTETLRFDSKCAAEAGADNLPRPIAEVRSTGCASFNFSRQRANTASGTATGVSVIASAYSSTSRSNSEKSKSVRYRPGGRSTPPTRRAPCSRLSPIDS